MELDEIELALHDIDAAAGIDPSDSRIFSLMGDILDKKQDFQGAIQAYTKVMELFPNHGYAAFKRAHIFYKESAFKEAIQDYQLVTEIEPSHPPSYYNVACCHARLCPISSTSLRRRPASLSP